MTAGPARKRTIRDTPPEGIAVNMVMGNGIATNAGDRRQYPPSSSRVRPPSSSA